MADGCLSKKHETGWQFSIEVSGVDAEHLQKFAEFTRSTMHHSYRGKYEFVCVRLSGKHLSESLLKWGIVPQKTKNFVTPRIPNMFLTDYLRGWFDGDGHIGRARHTITIAGNHDALEWYASALVRAGFPLAPRVSRIRHVNCSHLTISDSGLVALFQDLLDGSPRLERKWQIKAQCLHRPYADTPYRPRDTHGQMVFTAEDECLAKQLYINQRRSLSEVAASLRVGVDAVRTLFRRMGIQVRRGGPVPNRGAVESKSVKPNMTRASVYADNDT
jgi:hypothetical protein